MDLYSLPVSLDWLKANLKIIIGNRDLAEIMAFGDLWRSRGHRPLVHVVSPAMDNGKMWDKHEDPSGLLDNIPSHIDLFIVDFFNREKPEIPKMWDQMTSPPKWLLWEYAPGKVKFNGTYKQFIDTFGVDPAAAPPTSGGGTGQTPTTGGGDITYEIPKEGILVHLQCPHCGKLLY
jgi:hypothetical protein